MKSRKHSEAANQPFKYPEWNPSIATALLSKNGHDSQRTVTAAKLLIYIDLQQKRVIGLEPTTFSLGS